MSRANSGRKSNDNYPTPLALAKAIVEEVLKRVPAKSTPLRVLEPSAGAKAHFIRALRDHPRIGPREQNSAHITAIDLLDCSVGCLGAGADKFAQGDCYKIARAAEQTDERFDLIIGNPPFSFAEDHIRALWPLLAPGGILAFLLRLNFFGSETRWTDEKDVTGDGGNSVLPGREAFWKVLPEDETRVIIPRPMFKLNKDGKPGSDGTEYAVITWCAMTPAAGFGTVAHRRYRGDAIFWTPDPAERAAMIAEGAAAPVPGLTAGALDPLAPDDAPPPAVPAPDAPADIILTEF